MPRRAAGKADPVVVHEPNDQTGAAAAGITINPATNDHTLNPTDALDESITVKIPKGNNCNNVKLVASSQSHRSLFRLTRLLVTVRS